MKVSKELIDSILKDGRDSEHIATIVSKYINMTSELNKLKNELLKNEADFISRKRVIEDKIEKIRLDCRHPTVSRYSDPSGGNDSFHECDVCGAVWT